MRKYCMTCKVLTFEDNPNHKDHRLKNLPSQKQLEHWVFDGVAKTPEGKKIEPDAPDSWLSILGII